MRAQGVRATGPRELPNQELIAVEQLGLPVVRSWRRVGTGLTRTVGLLITRRNDTATSGLYQQLRRRSLHVTAR
jgi:hypothetical protein